MARLTITEILNRFKKVHGDKYNYSKINYKNSETKIEIICPEHGSFFQTPYSHYSGHGCKKCSNIKKLANLNDLLKNFKKVHGDKYNYSKAKYSGTYNKIEIICPEHGSFFQTSSNHLLGHGCPTCSKKINYNKIFDNFIKIHKNKYDYSKTKYINSKTKIEIICPEHGSFFQLPASHTQGHGCPTCGMIKSSSGQLSKQSEILEQFKKVHCNKYNYSKVNYCGMYQKVEIICSKHGSFFQYPNNHLNGSGCPNCSISKKKTQDEVIKEFEKVHGNKYNYSKINYRNAHTKVEIICSEHGSFFQVPLSHKYGSGCPKCSLNQTQSKGAQKVQDFLEENNIKYIQEYKFQECKNINSLPFDFYLPDLNILIEYDGQLHYKAIAHFGGEQTLLQTQKRDKIKTDFAKKENIKLIRIPYWHSKRILEILEYYLKN